MSNSFVLNAESFVSSSDIRASVRNMFNDSAAVALLQLPCEKHLVWDARDRACLVMLPADIVEQDPDGGRYKLLLEIRYTPVQGSSIASLLKRILSDVRTHPEYDARRKAINEYAYAIQRKQRGEVVVSSRSLNESLQRNAKAICSNSVRDREMEDELEELERVSCFDPTASVEYYSQKIILKNNRRRHI